MGIFGDYVLLEVFDYISGKKDIKVLKKKFDKMLVIGVYVLRIKFKCSSIVFIYDEEIMMIVINVKVSIIVIVG